MNRRSFLAGLAAVPVAAKLPLETPAIPASFKVDLDRPFWVWGDQVLVQYRNSDLVIHSLLRKFKLDPTLNYRDVEAVIDLTNSPWFNSDVASPNIVTRQSLSAAYQKAGDSRLFTKRAFFSGWSRAYDRVFGELLRGERHTVPVESQSREGLPSLADRHSSPVESEGYRIVSIDR